ncbi:hypothetical protein U9M48_000850 [Paspalum notatum var. saurae]|uniref:Uncharacterized protein n=1 Tax=Paspalum notatum var. saurae TaxID=547442 RepID=A0AAQ3PME6_PASNO
MHHRYQNAHKTVENMSRIKRWKPLVKVARSADPHPGRPTRGWPPDPLIGSADPWSGRPTSQVSHLPPH